MIKLLVNLLNNLSDCPFLLFMSDFEDLRWRPDIRKHISLTDLEPTCCYNRHYSPCEPFCMIFVILATFTILLCEWSVKTIVDLHRFALIFAFFWFLVLFLYFCFVFCFLFYCILCYFYINLILCFKILIYQFLYWISSN